MEKSLKKSENIWADSTGKKGDNEGGIYTTPKGYSFIKEHMRSFGSAFLMLRSGCGLNITYVTVEKVLTAPF